MNKILDSILGGEGQEMVGTMKSWLAEIFVKLMSTEVLGEDTF